MKGFGYRAESLAALWLRLRGYRILERNFRSRFGEIDIIAKKHGVTVFCEVKARSGNMLFSPAQAVDIYKQQKIIKTAYYYLSRCDAADGDIRFDVIEVKKKGLHITVRQIQNAFEI